MRKIFLFCLVLFSYSSLLSQNNNGNAANQSLAVSGKVYAVIVGISKYQASGITQLEYADRDAKVFADYLKSKAGGSVPEDNIRLLTNENATFAAIYDALDWLIDVCKKDDVVFFYFSGHGDQENNTIYKLGFLLSYNTPRMNYINNAVRLEDLNIVANTLSSKRQSKVVLITDACHSGNLAGNENRGNFLVGDQLREVIANETRITSCGPDQLSNEDERWGGGRGVFSYYLVNGLTGLADKSADGIITADEIKDYLNSSLSSDVLLAQKKDKQDPVVNGQPDFKLAKVDKASLNALQQRFSSGQNNLQVTSAAFLKPLPMQPQGYLFSLIGKNNLEELVDFNKLDQFPKEEIPFVFIKMLTDSIQRRSGQQTEDSLKIKIDNTKITSLVRSLKENKDALSRFNDKLVVTLSDRGQEIINLYLNGDEAELEKRRYYNSKSSGYDVYPKMFSVALKLASPETQLHHILEVKFHYFSGVAARLKLPTVEDPKPLLDIANSEQQKAFKLEENAAYIQNEMGILSEFKKDYSAAEKYFFRATQIAPTWAIPQANLCGLYALEKKFDKGLEAGRIADSLQPGLQITNVNIGLVNEFSGNLLFAEEDYRKSIDINSRHYIPFERLGYVYMNTTKYALADSFFYEAEKRKKGYHFEGNDWSMVASPFVLPVTAREHCDVDTNKIKKKDVMAFFTWGLQNYYDSNYKNAAIGFKKVIALDKKNPLVFHYMGKIYYDQKNWEAAEVMFKYAIEYYKEQEAFDQYCDSVIKSVIYPYPHDCFERFFHASYYEKIEDYFFIAHVYELWSHYEEAETYFRKCIELSPDRVDGYIKLWNMLEKLGRFTEAEQLIKSYALYDKEISERELNEFYRRVIKQFPKKGDWYYRLGLLLYSRAEQPARAVYFDTIVHFPVLNQEKFIDFDVYERLLTDPDLFIGDKNDRNSPQSIELKGIREMRRGVQIPGTDESISLADAIYTPRKDGIEFLSKASDLIIEKETVADINFKIGNIFVWSGSKKQAFAYYDKSIQLIPENAAARLRIIDVCKAIYKNRAALENLDYLYDHKKINFPNQILLAEFSMYAGQFNKAKKNLEEAEAIHPYVLPEIADLNGRLLLLSGDPSRAILYYEDYLNVHPDDANTMYSMATLYAKIKNPEAAWDYLDLSIKAGFNYYWVLKYDKNWNDYRKQGKWNEITGKVKQRNFDFKQ